MAKVTPYRSLPADRRLSLVTHMIESSREAREQYVQRLAARPGGIRAVTLRTWPVSRIASEFVRQNAQNANDELDLLHLLYVDVEPAIQKTFLDAAGVPNDNGRIADDAEPPYADADAVIRGTDAVRSAHGDDGERYLRTLAKYNRDAWPGIEALAGDDADEKAAK